MLNKMDMLHVVLLCLLVNARAAEEKRYLLSTLHGGQSGTRHLEKYNVDKSKISVSGVSAGASMATQMHVIYSSHIMGVGMISGAPYVCPGVGGVTSALTCMTLPSLISTTLEASTTLSEDAAGLIDDTANMKNDRIWIFNGRNDTQMNPGLGAVTKEYYGHFVMLPSNIKTVSNIDAEHGQPTLNYGGPCNQLSSKTSYLINCNFSAAYDLLNFIYAGHMGHHNLVKPVRGAAQTGQLIKFYQSDVFTLTSPSLYSLDTYGYIYVPQRCASKRISCKLHVAFHGCKMGRQFAGETYVRHAGYNEVADLNDIIILYPQAISSLYNLNGCWDWFGYTGLSYATNKGFQPSAIKRMIDKITG